jgi:type II secretory pathway pseudopilin PulG
MRQILGRRRKGFTLAEEAIVIALIAILAIPLVTLLNQSIRAQVYGTKDVKGQYALNVIMQDFERRIRRADASEGGISITTGDPYEVSFTYKNSDEYGKKLTSVKYHYELDDANTKDALFYRWKDDETETIFPADLEKGIIINFSVTLPQDSGSGAYYLDVTLESKETILEKTIYLINYSP